MRTLVRVLTGAVLMAAAAVALTAVGWWPRIDLLVREPRPGAVLLGVSRLVVPVGATVGAQVDRVVRDVAWAGSKWDERAPPDRVPESIDDLVPYMEGMLISELMRHARVRVLPLTPATARLNAQDATWYAADADGRFRFALDSSEIPHRTPRRVADDVLEIVDTHGFNSIAALAARARPFLAVACMDLPSSADAALHLAERGIHVYGPADRFSYRLLGYRTYRPRAATILGSAPIRAGPGGGAVIGAQPVKIEAGETVVVQWTDKPYPYQYSDTPWRYFSELTSRLFLDLTLVRVPADAGNLASLLAKARARGASVVGVRVGKSTSMEEAIRDAEALSAWLRENPLHRAVLFHSAPYEPGYKLFFDFPNQTTFGDLAPVLISRFGVST
jgi:hypothetical protein